MSTLLLYKNVLISRTCCCRPLEFLSCSYGLALRRLSHHITIRRIGQTLRPFQQDSRWLAAAAAAHNKEQHAAKSNIDSVIGMESKEVDQMAAYRIAFWDGKGIQITKNQTSEDLVRRAIESSARNYFSTGADNYHNVLTNVGTLHQFVGKGDKVNNMIDALDMEGAEVQ